MLYVGCDTGGTFTDFILFDELSEKIVTYKTPSTPADPSLAIKNGLTFFLREHLIKSENAFIIFHGTTVSTNTVLEKKGATVALITTKGFRDVLEIGRQNRPLMYQLHVTKPPILVPASHRLEVDERILYDGTIEKSLTDKELTNLLTKINKLAPKPDSFAISLLFSFKNSEHEDKIFTFLQKNNISKHISLSSKILPVMNEYERTSATVLDAYIAPKIENYLLKIDQMLTNIKINAKFYILQSDAGLTTKKGATTRPISTLLSGLAGGVLGAKYTAQTLNLDSVISLDIGGTSTDVSLLLNKTPTLRSNATISNLPIFMPVVDVVTIGAGGGSIAELRHGILHVGPESAGADPGPACYGKGGSQPTVTDAQLLQGILNANNFCGGRLPLYPNLAHNVIDELAKKMKLSLENAILGILKVFHQNIASAIRKVSIERGYDPRNMILIPFGGAGPAHAAFIAEIMEIKEIIVPQHPGIWSSVGLLMADFQSLRQQSIIKNVLTLQKDDLDHVIANLKQKVYNDLHSQGLDVSNLKYEITLQCRYYGQAYELDVPYTENTAVEEITQHFHAIHQRNFGYSSPEEVVEIVNIIVRGVIPRKLPRFPKLKEGKESPSEGSIVAKRKVLWDTNIKLSTPIYKRSALLYKNKIQGPAIIEQMDSTTAIPPNWEATILKHGEILLQKKP